MAKEKTVSEYNQKDWKNLGIYITLIGLIILFVGKQVMIGLGFFAVGIVFLAIFNGTKILKILHKKNW